MINAVVMSMGSVEGLARTLSDLVAGAVDGVVKRVAVAAPIDAQDSLFEVSDDSGAAFKRLPGGYGERAAAAAAAVDGDWMMLLDAGARLQPDWHLAAADHIHRRPDQAAVIVCEKAGFLRPQPVLALILPRRLYDEAGGFGQADSGLRPLFKRLERRSRAVRL
jgi:hypothetical protein